MTASHRVDSASHGIPSIQMSAERAPKRAYDDRINRVLRLVEGLAERGHDPRVIELDGLYIELGEPRSDGITAAPGPTGPGPSVPSVPFDPGPDPADDPDSVDSYRSSVRSYRQRAHAALERRMREARQ